MKKLPVAFLLLFALSVATAQTPKELHETAKSFMQQADYMNAVMVLNRALEQDPQNTAMSKDLSLSYYFQRNIAKAMETIIPLLDRADADDQCFQIAGMIYKMSDSRKDLEKMYRKGLARFPDSGPLYNELGEYLWGQKNGEAISLWEKGIEIDPSFSKNYYNAAKYHFLSSNLVWSLLYGEIFINMDPYGPKTPEIKQLLLDGYKRLFVDVNLEAANTDKTPFVVQFLKSMNAQTNVASLGINPETLSMIRTRFILDWFNNPETFPCSLFRYQQLLLQNGIFEAYNQWIFGSPQNLGAYQIWINTHADENAAFLNFQKGRVFKVTDHEYYHR
jgi:tetratricopeptide (TPR) repeat protein